MARGRRGQNHLPPTPEEFSSFRSTLHKVNWLAREPRPEASGVVSTPASRLDDAILRDAWYLNRLIGKICDSACRPIIIWPVDRETMFFISMSDAGGVGGGETRLEADGQSARRHPGRLDHCRLRRTTGSRASGASVSNELEVNELKRKVPSIRAGEALSLSAAIAEVEWQQYLYRDVMFEGLRCPD